MALLKRLASGTRPKKATPQPLDSESGHRHKILHKRQFVYFSALLNIELCLCTSRLGFVEVTYDIATTMEW